MKVYIVIPNYTANDELRALVCNAIASMRATAPSATIVVVDDASPEDSKFLDGVADHVIRRPQNDGFAMTCNDGFRWVMSDCKDDCYIVCANNDIEVFPGWVEAMVEQMEMFDNVAFAGLVSNKERVIDGVPIDKWSRYRISEGGMLDGWMQSGGLWMSKKSVLQKIGLFDEDMKGGGMEDVDIFLRARDKFGMRLMMSARSMFWHKEGATRWGVSGEFRKRNKEIELENEEKFKNKWGFYYRSRGVWKESVLVNR